MSAPKTVLALTAILSFLAGGALTAALGAAAPPLVVVVDYMKTAPGREDAYVRLERELWKPVHTARIRAGAMRSWSLYKVRFPHGAAVPYDYVTVNVFDSVADADRDPLAWFPQVHPERTVPEVMRDTEAARELVRGELWYRLDHAE